MSSLLPAGAPVVVDTESRTTRVLVSGSLDTVTGGVIRQSVTAAVAAGAERLELDLTSVTETTPEGVAVISWFVTAGEGLLRGVGVAVATAAGRAALLASLLQMDGAEVGR